MLRPAGVVWLDALLARSSPIEQSAGASEGGDVAATVAEDAPVLIHLRAARAVPRLPLAYQEAITPISSCGLGIGLVSTHTSSAAARCPPDPPLDQLRSRTRTLDVELLRLLLAAGCCSLALPGLASGLYK